ncbi:MAG: hypothetical protein Q3W81_03105, partial [Slackia sp.]|nr:hypothetical protein [Slackia sp.]
IATKSIVTTVAHAKFHATNSAQIRRETAQGRCERAESSGEKNNRKCTVITALMQATKSTAVKRQPYSASTE